MKNSFSISGWIVANAVGWILGIALTTFIAEGLSEINLDFAGMGIGIAAGVGLTQWIFLRKYNISMRWVALQVVGIGSSFLLLNLIFNLLPLLGLKAPGELTRLVVSIFCAAIGGSVSAWLHHRFITKIIIDRGWIVVNGSAWFLTTIFIAGYFLAVFNYHMEQTTSGKIMNLTVFLVAGPLLGIITARIRNFIH